MEKEVEVKVEQVDQVDGLWILNLKASGKMQPSNRHLPKKEEKIQFSNIGRIAWRKKSFDGLLLILHPITFVSTQIWTHMKVGMIDWWSLVKLLMDSLSLLQEKLLSLPLRQLSILNWIVTPEIHLNHQDVDISLEF